MNPTDQEAHKRWTKDVNLYDIPHLRLIQVAYLINKIKPNSVVDLGCAMGTLRTIINKNIEYTGVDFVKQEGKVYDFNFKHIDLLNLEFPNDLSGKDLYSCSGILEYIGNLNEFLARLNFIMPENGNLICTYFNMKHISRRLKKISGNDVYRHPDWKSNYSLNEFKKILNDTGFDIKCVFITSQSLSHSAPVSKTIDVNDAYLLKAGLLASVIGHQFIFHCKKK